MALIAAALMVAALSTSPSQASMEAAGPDGPLRGTLTQPGTSTAGAPVVLIIPGSGPTDRDGDSPLGIKAAPYVGVDDARRLKAADPRAELVLLANTNHVLKTVISDDRGANVATYADPFLPLASGVVEPIVRFIERHEGD